MQITPGPVVLAAGDIADDGHRAAATAALLESLPNATILALGDNAYRCGTKGDYQDHYTPTWGQPALLARTRACPGNHEYGVAFCFPKQKGKAYFAYFAESHQEVWSTGANTKDFYSFAIADCRWHFVSLNSEIPTKEGSAQWTWLRNDLEAHQGQPILAFFHRPRFSSGHHGSQKDLQDLWRLLCDFKTEIVLNGHDHTYERFEPQDADQNADASGVATFVIGTGGREFDPPQVNQEKNSAFPPKEELGVLKLVLNDSAYDWEFLSTSGQAVESGQHVAVNPGHE